MLISKAPRKATTTSYTPKYACVEKRTVGRTNYSVSQQQSIARRKSMKQFRSIFKSNNKFARSGSRVLGGMGYCRVEPKDIPKKHQRFSLYTERPDINAGKPRPCSGRFHFLKMPECSNKGR